MKPLYTLSSLLYRPFFARLVKAPLLIVVAVLYIFQAPAQSYYPGGLGNTDLLIWLNAQNSASIIQSFSQVSQWSDLSGHGYRFIQNTFGRQPIYGATTGPNSRPALTFTSTSQHHLARTNLPATLSFTGGVSSFAVAKFNASQTAQGFERIYDFGVGQANNNIWMGRQNNSANMGYECRNAGTIGQTYTTTGSIVNGVNNIYEVVQDGGTVGAMSTVTHLMAGTTLASTGTSGSTTWVPVSVDRTSDYLGRSNWAADNYLSGSMSEILFFNRALNTTQRIIIENYLSAAWALPVSVSRYTPPTSTTYSSNLVGIGYTSASDYFLADVSGSTDGLGFSSTTGATGFLNTTGYVMAAHNKQTNTLNSNITITGIGNNLYKWNRSWRVQKTGGNSSGTITVNFDFSDYNGSSPNSTYSYAILHNATDGTFATGTNQLMSVAEAVTGNIVSFAVNAADLSNGYYTLVWSQTAILLPVTLTGFTAARQAGSSLLQWSTAQEINSHHFEVQRSPDGAFYSTIGSVAAKGNSAVASRYSYTDESPAAGRNYYRLKMVDDKGAATYSAIRVVDFTDLATVSLEMYPNPVVDVLHITGVAMMGNITIRIINTRGQIVKTVRQSVSGIMNVDMGDLPKGLYIAEINSDKVVYKQKVIKR